jgi:hypothetical protein
MQLASLEDPIALVQLGWGDRFRHLEDERQSAVERLDHPGGHLRSGVPIPGADAAAPSSSPRRLRWWPISSSITRAGMHEVDPTTSDEERPRWDVPALAEALRRADQTTCSAAPGQSG